MNLFIRLVFGWGVFLLALGFWPEFEDAFKLPQFCVLTVLAVVVVTSTRESGITGWRVPLLALGLAHAAGMIVTPSARAPDVIWLCAGTALAWYLPDRLRDSRWRPRLLAALEAAGALAACYSLVQFTGFDLVGNGTGERMVRPFSTMGNPDFLAAYLIAVLPLSVVRTVRAPSVFAALRTTVILAGLMLAQSRGAWLGMIGAVAATIVLITMAGRRLRPGRTIVVAGALAVAGIVSFFALHEAAHERVARMFSIRHFDAAGRLFMWDATLRMIRERPLMGHGLGGYGRSYPERHAEQLRSRPDFPYFYTENAHNDYFQIAADGGIVVLGLWVWVWSVFAAMAWRKWVAGSWDALGILLGFVSFQVNAVFNFPWYLLPAHGWFWLVFSWMASAGRREVTAHRGRTVKWRVPLTAVVAVAMLTAMGRMLYSNAALKLSGDAVAAGRWPAALHYARGSLDRWLLWEGAARSAGNGALAAYNLGDLKMAEGLARRSLALQPGSPSALNQLALAQARQGRYEEAEEACRQALRLNPHQAESYHALGNIAYLKGDVADAEINWRKAIKEKPDLEGARRSLNELLRRRGGGRE